LISLIIIPSGTASHSSERRAFFRFRQFVSSSIVIIPCLAMHFKACRHAISSTYIGLETASIFPAPSHSISPALFRATKPQPPPLLAFPEGSINIDLHKFRARFGPSLLIGMTHVSSSLEKISEFHVVPLNQHCNLA
jgi:hypothetical protein